MTDAYLGNETIRFLVKALPALAFCNQEKVSIAFEELRESATDFPELDVLYDYYESNYIGRRTRNGRRNPRFAIQFWNQADRTNADLPRTNNHIEGYHHGIQSALDGQHPSIFKWMKFIQKEENYQHLIGMQWTAGESGRRNKEAEARARRLMNILNEEGNRTTIEFLRGITYNYNMG